MVRARVGEYFSGKKTFDNGMSIEDVIRTEADKQMREIINDQLIRQECCKIEKEMIISRTSQELVSEIAKALKKYDDYE